MPMFFRFLLLTSLLLVTAGCNEATNPAAGPDPGDDPQGTANRETDLDWLIGAWQFITPAPNQPNSEYAAAVYEIVESDAGKLAVEVADKYASSFEPTALAVRDGGIELRLNTRGGPARFIGKHHDRYILGAFERLGGSGVLNTARMVKVGERTLPATPSVEPIAGAEELAAIGLDGAVPPRKIADVQEAAPQSSLPVKICRELVRQSYRRGYDADELDELISTTLQLADRWGSLYALHTRLAVMQALLEQRTRLDIVEQLLDQYVAAPAGTLPPYFDLALMRQQLEVARGIAKYESSPDQGIEELVRLNEKYGHVPQIEYLLASHDLDRGSTADAIEHLTEIVARPSAERALVAAFQARGERNPIPSVQLGELWEAIHGSKAGLEEHLGRAFGRVSLDFAPEAEPSGEPAPLQRTVLVELLTGPHCPPCIAADLAVSGVAKAYPDHEVITLQYPQHNAGVNPLVTAATEQRATFYRATATPKTFVNGRETPPLGGGYTRREQSFEKLRDVVGPAVDMKTDVDISLTATQDGPSIHWTADINQLPPKSGDYRLFLAVAEEEVYFRGRNGAPVHHMVVRDLIDDGFTGTPINEAPASFSGTYDTEGLIARIRNFQSDHRASGRPEFYDPPLELKHLVLVGFVQDAETKEIFQAARIPFGGLPEDSKWRPERETKAPATQPSPSGNETPTEPVVAPRPTTDDVSLLEEFGELQPVVFLQDETDAAEEKPKQPEPRTDFAGRWLLVFLQVGRQTPLALLDVTKGDKRYLGELLDSPPGIKPLTLDDLQAVDDSLTATFTLRGETELTFRGELSDGAVFGSLRIEGQVAPEIAFLTPVDDRPFQELLDNFERRPVGFDRFVAAARSDDPIAAFEEFAADFPKSPLRMFVFPQLASMSVGLGLDDKQIGELATRHVQTTEDWSNSLSGYAKLQVAEVLIDNGLALRVAGQNLDAFKESLSEEEQQGWQETLDEIARRLSEEQLKAKLLTGSADDQAEAAAGLVELDDASPEIAYLLADFYDRTGKGEKALTEFARLAVTPGVTRAIESYFSTRPQSFPTPLDRAEKLYPVVRDDAEASFNEYLLGEYDRLTKQLTKQPDRKGNPARNRTTLVELFTGAMCPPCVAADLASGAIERVYPASEVLVIRYHMHIPGPDPLAIPDTDDLFATYDLRGTPSLLLNGDPLPFGGGGYAQSAEVRDRLLEQLAEAPQTSAVTLSVDAKTDGDRLTISAAAESEEELPPNARLRILLVEDEVVHAAPNGIRRHEMVVRRMVNGPFGTAVDDGKLAFEGRLSLQEFKQTLVTEIESFEESQNGFQFDRKPFDLEKLSVIAIVQQGRSGEVLNATRVAVPGPLHYDGGAEKE